MSRRMPAEWEPHEATWIAWPHHEPDWPGKIEAVSWVYAEIVRVIARYERVEILCHDEKVEEEARRMIAAHDVEPDSYRLHRVATDRVWLRDSAPTAVVGESGLEFVRWRFNAWAKYDNYALDAKVPEAIAGVTDLPLVAATRPDGRGPIVLEGGAIDTNGDGMLLVTEECLLSEKVQVRNPGLDRDGYEHAFREYLGTRRTIWLGAGCVGDDTHGHIDDIARFIAPDTVLLAYEADPADENHESSEDNLRRLRLAGGDGTAFKVVQIPYPRAVVMDGARLPASYLNFYIANGIVVVPTFNDTRDREALSQIARLMPDREVVGIHAVDLVWGFGTLHCLTQQQPAAPTRVRGR